MKTILFSQLPKRNIDKAFVDLITIDRFALEVVIGQQLYQVLGDDNKPFYSHNLQKLKQQLATLDIGKVYLHETVSFAPSLGLEPSSATDWAIDLLKNSRSQN